MAILDLYSKRARRARGDVPDVYSYDLPPGVRTQIVHILRDLYGEDNARYNQYKADEAYKTLHDALCREYGRFRLSESYHSFSHWRQAITEFLMSAPTEEALDVVELGFNFGHAIGEDWQYTQDTKPKLKGAAAIAELNSRLREAGVGYQFEHGKLVRVDSKLMHAEAVKPALQLLSDPTYAGANDEFLNAHEHHRHGRQEESMTEALKALESTLKIICKKRHWTYNETDTAKTLLDVVFKNGLIPTWLQAEFTALRSTLESGVPTSRNKSAGHGQGATVRTVPPHMAAYVLHMTASAIVFLIESDKALK